MSEQTVKQGNLSFQAEGRLLQELGERLVASPEVALVELIKNAYDADAKFCGVELDRDKGTLAIRDEGTGMTFEAFQTRWMRIGTSNKAEQRVSSKFGRHLTGQKGIGRFAVRFLGDHLTLNTVAYDKQLGKKTRLIAEFPWADIDKAIQLVDTKIHYVLTVAGKDSPTGTLLVIKRLKGNSEFVTSAKFRTDVLRIVSPVQGLDRGRFKNRDDSKKDEDPGFDVILPGDKQSTRKGGIDLASEVLKNAWAKLTINCEKGKANFEVSFGDETESKVLRFPFKTSISKGLFADIRFFPRRAGIFRGKEVKGDVAWAWIKENAGVAVVDHGFRVKPYGFRDDDWLNLDLDIGHNERSWRSVIAEDHFPMSKLEKSNPALNPMLNLPSNLQLVGAIFVESQPASLSRREDDLTPSMDREGFLRNRAFLDLNQIVRAGIEFLAFTDKRRQLAEKERRAREAAKKTRADFKAALEFIEQSPTLTGPDKARLIQEYSGLAQKLVEVEEYDREARRKLEIMSSLGVVAGFVTHEASRIVSNLEEAIKEIRKLANHHPSLKSILASIEEKFGVFRGHLKYTKLFIDSVQDEKVASFKAASQIKRIINNFGSFARERGIDVECEIAADVEVPPMPVTVYSGIILNLYTNAIKAIVARESSSEHSSIVFRGWNEPKRHVVEVLDTGIGIPPNMRSRIWDPLFTTTSRLNNPLGSGMGLGLSLVRELVHEYKGKVEVVDAPSDFSTCFRVEFPR